MKLEIFNADRPATKPPVRLRLQNCTDGVEVVAVDANGDTVTAGYLLRFNNNGTVFMQSVVNPRLGFAQGCP